MLCRSLTAGIGFVATLWTADPLWTMGVSGCVILDTECDGVFQRENPGLAATVLVTPLFGDDPETLTFETSPDVNHGEYLFEGLPEGEYRLEVEVPDEFVFAKLECTLMDQMRCPRDSNPTTIDLTENSLRRKLNFLLCHAGVCCLPDGSCVDVSEAECAARQGVYAGNGTLCADVECGRTGPCWMTAGGIRFDRETGTFNVQVDRGDEPRDSAVGVVLPACAQPPSSGGNWDHIARGLGLRIRADDVFAVRCGDAGGIAPGGPTACPLSFIEFEGSGTAGPVGDQQIGGIPVTFFGRVEDRGEPGDDGAGPAGDVDRYFFKAIDPDGNTVLLIDEDGIDDGAVDPGATTGGDFRIHCARCEGGSPEGRFAEGLRQGTFFLRGDLNVDGRVDVSDAAFGLDALFGRASDPRCMDAADANDDGVFDVSDPITLFLGLFAEATIAPPFPVAGIDRTVDGLDCGLLLR